MVQQCRRLFDARDGSAQLGIEDIEHRRLDEELDELGRQAGQQLAHQEVADGAIRAGERIQEVLRSDAPLQRDRRQLRAGRPSLGELVQAAQLIPGQADVVQCEELGHLAWSEAEIVATQLEQIAAQTQPGQRQWRVRPGRGGEAEAVG